MEHTIKEYQEKFVEDLQKNKKSHSTVLAYGKDVDQFVQYLHQGQVEDASSVTQDHISSFAEELRKKRYTEKSIVRKINSIKAFFKFLQDEDIVANNPVNRVKRPKVENEAPRVLTKIEYRALRDACRADQRISAIVELLLQTGMRISELAALSLDDIDFSNKVVKIKNEENGGVRSVPLNIAAIRSIEEYLKFRPKTREKTLFLTKTCKPFLVRNIRAAIDRYFRLAGIKDAKVNDLRHTFIVEQLAAGVPLVYVSQIVGHKRITTTEKYLQLVEQSLDPSNVKIEEL